MKVEYCEDCLKDDTVFCKRNPDAQCLECGARLCAGHIAGHLQKEHCMSLSMEYCSEKIEEGGGLSMIEATIKQDLGTLKAFWMCKKLSGKAYKALLRAYLVPPTHRSATKPLSELSDKELLKIHGIGPARLQEIRGLFPSPK